MTKLGKQLKIPQVELLQLYLQVSDFSWIALSEYAMPNINVSTKLLIHT